MKQTDLRFSPAVVASDRIPITRAALVADYEVAGEVFFIQGTKDEILTVVTARGETRQITFTDNNVMPCMMQKVIYNGVGDTAVTFFVWV